MTEYTDREKQNFAKNLNYLIENSGLSTRETVDRLGYEQPTLYRWRTGMAMPSEDAMQDIADFYGTTVSDLLGARLPRQKMRIELPDGLIVSVGTGQFSVEGKDASSGLDDVKFERYNANTVIVRVALKGRIL